MRPEPLFVRFGKRPCRTNSIAWRPSPLFDAATSLAPQLAPSGASRQEQQKTLNKIHPTKSFKKLPRPVRAGTKLPSAACPSCANLSARIQYEIPAKFNARFISKQTTVNTLIKSHGFSSQRRGNSYLLCGVSVLAPVRPNPSFKPSTNGVPRGPGRRYAVHFRHPGPRVTPLVPA